MNHDHIHRHLNLLWIFVGVTFCALFLVFSLPKSMILMPTGAQVAEFAPDVLAISSITPTSILAQGETVQLGILGTGFNSNAVVSVSSSDVKVVSSRILDNTQIEVVLSVSGSASPGTYDIAVTQGAESASLAVLTVKSK